MKPTTYPHLKLARKDIAELHKWLEVDSRVQLHGTFAAQ